VVQLFKIVIIASAPGFLEQPRRSVRVHETRRGPRQHRHLRVRRDTIQNPGTTHFTNLYLFRLKKIWTNFYALFSNTISTSKTPLSSIFFWCHPCQLYICCHKTTRGDQKWLFALCRQLEPDNNIWSGCTDKLNI
jgi:hypothetical protein